MTGETANASDDRIGGGGDEQVGDGAPFGAEDPSPGYSGESGPGTPAETLPGFDPNMPQSERLAQGPAAADDGDLDTAASGAPELTPIEQRRQTIVERLKRLQRLQDRLLEKIDSLVLD